MTHTNISRSCRAANVTYASQAGNDQLLHCLWLLSQCVYTLPSVSASLWVLAVCMK